MGIMLMQRTHLDPLCKGLPRLWCYNQPVLLFRRGKIYTLVSAKRKQAAL